MTKFKFTAERIRLLKSSAGKRQTFYRDERQPGLGLRVTAAGAKSYIFEASLRGESLRVTIGDVATWPLADASRKAAELKRLVDEGIDPRHRATEMAAADGVRKDKKKRMALTLGEVRPRYVEIRRSKWSISYYNNHVNFAHAGGVAKRRGTGNRKSGALHCLMKLQLSELTSDRITAWLAAEKPTRPTNVLLCFGMLRSFMNWAVDRPEYKDLVDPSACRTRSVAEEMPKRRAKDGDCLQREHLAAWFSAISGLPVFTTSAYLQTLLLTGARRTELASLKWTNVDFDWRTMKIHDKDASRGGQQGYRTIPMTPYVSALIQRLKGNGSEFVFASSRSGCGHITEARLSHGGALAKAGIPHVTLHGLRRSFRTLSEWVEVPHGVVAQIMGHKPSATAEKHYTRRSIDMLRNWHDKIEAWVLAETLIDFTEERAPIEPVA
jgi:integrase